ncbi:Serine/threonine-protein kinase [Ceratobasidium sp. AG-Ba]|nr:Serine/threonine-protein kinase [Ceratobasidium sp. AG-Ba]QRW11025.1 Serine/threonine-protein kinase [Ceratobasidium sp. AG-Ba]
MDISNDDVPPPPYTPDERRTATFAQVSNRIQGSIGNASIFQDALAAFGTFLASQENVTLSRIHPNSCQLEVLKSQCVLVLEEMAGCFKNGKDISEILADVIGILTSISSDLESKAQWATLFANPNQLRELEVKIGEASNGLDNQLQVLFRQKKQSELHIYKLELLKALDRDRKKIQELEEIIKEMRHSIENLDACVQKLMEDSLKILGDRTLRKQQAHAKRSLAIIAELTGKSLPPAALVGPEFVKIGTHAIHQGSSYDVFLGEYFTGERIVIKVLRQRLDEQTARKKHQRFARQATNWSSMRHDAILPFYGIGVAPDPLGGGDYQLYMVSPYLQNQDARRYLTKYGEVSLLARFQMVLDIARGLAYMHEGGGASGAERGIVHSSLNIFNVLIKDSGRAVISGFGHSKVISDFQESFTGDTSEYRYMAPEVLQDDAPLSHGTDVWSWAMTSLEILTDTPPFGKKSSGPKIIRYIHRGEKPLRSNHPKIEQYSCRDDLWNLFEECWNADPNHRPSADQIAGYLKSMLSRMYKKPSTRDQPQLVVSSQMPVSEIVECLKAHHCLDITSKLEMSKCGPHPVAGGGFADVYQGSLQDGRKVAIKRPRLFVQNDQAGKEMIKLAAREMYTASKLIHPNVIRVTGLVLFHNSLAIISPWMENGIITQYLTNNPEVDRCKLCLDICNGLAYLHSKPIVHGDLKGANVLVSADGVAKISDFGNTILKQYTLAFTGSNDLKGLSMRWTPHELLTDETAGTKPTRAADVYALGMVRTLLVGLLVRIVTIQNVIRPYCKRPPAIKVAATVSDLTPSGLKKVQANHELQCSALKPGSSPVIEESSMDSGPHETTTPLPVPGSYIHNLSDKVLSKRADPEGTPPAATSHAHALAGLDDLQAYLSQIGSQDFQAEQSVLESLRSKLYELGYR